MQQEFDFEPTQQVENFFYMTTDLSTNELCYTSKTSYGKAVRFTQDQAMVKLIKLGYTKKDARLLLIRAKRSEKWIVYHYQQCFNF